MTCISGHCSSGIEVKPTLVPLILWLVDRLEIDADLFLHEVVIKDHRAIRTPGLR